MVDPCDPGARSAATRARDALPGAASSPGQKPCCIRAAMHPRWTASLGVAFRANGAAIPPSKRLASPAPPRSRCNAGFHHGLLAACIRPGEKRRTRNDLLTPGLPRIKLGQIRNRVQPQPGGKLPRLCRNHRFEKAAEHRKGTS